jgi:hypothetical protein
MLTITPPMLLYYLGEYTNTILYKSQFILIHVFFVYSVIMMVSTPTLYYTKVIVELAHDGSVRLNIKNTLHCTNNIQVTKI